LKTKNVYFKEAVLDFLKNRANRPLTLNEISGLLGLRKSEKKLLRKTLKALLKSGEIFRTKSGRYGTADKMNLITGVFEAHRDGYGFVIPDRHGQRDIFIPPRKTLAAMSGDRVIARIENPLKREGTILKVIERKRRKIIGEFIQERGLSYVIPRDRKIPYSIIIRPKNRHNARNGDTVLLEITSYPTMTRPPEGKIIKIIPEIEGPSQEIDLILEEYSVRRRFPENVRKEVRNIKRDIDLKRRIDLRDMLTVTIDGETAKDFDDAVSIKKKDGIYILYVHIADVGHYVGWETELDIEARKRGTSVYFPGGVIPMLPERLSNDLCSLVPGEDRLTITVEMHFNHDGELIKRRFYPSVIRSNERMTYTSVKKILVDHERSERQKYEYLLEMFETMEELCEILRSRRMERGSLDFDLPEPEILLDIQGRPENIVRADRNLAHMIIEEFMIAANEAVATYLEEKGIPSIYRVHEDPDPAKLEELLPILRAFNIHIKKIDAHTFHRIFKKIKGRPDEEILNVFLLRSLKQARYSPENIGHFGLASRCYTHFTSPIRRYPDLVVHRILKEVIHDGKVSKKKRRYLEEMLPDIATQSSRAERIADEVERDIVSVMRVWFMKEKMGEEFSGIISGLSSHGMKIQLKEYFVECFLPLSSLEDDYYIFDEKNYLLTGKYKRRTFRIGMPVKVRIERVDIEEREIFAGLINN